MALQRLVIDGYGQLELNQVAFRRDGRIEAQCKLAGMDFAENGMLLAIDQTKRTASKPTTGKEVIALNYTTEHMYDERAKGLKNFRLDKDTFLPRLGYLSVGDKFTTNCIAYEATEFESSEAAFKKAVEDLTATEPSGTPLYGIPCAEGAIQVTKTKGENSVTLQVVKATTMPDGQWAIKFVCVG